MVPLSEQDLIERFFHVPPRRDDVVIGVGDDGAVVRVPAGFELVAATDTVVAGVHFPDDAPADAVGHKALAVNLSDLAAMGAAPAWATLALTLPDADEAWLDGFSRGFLDLARTWDIDLVGGDTTRGPLAATVQVLGLVPAGTALRRGGARPGDWVCVTGTLGDAGLGLASWRGEACLSREDATGAREHLNRPVARVAAGQALRPLATAAIDVSDGLVTDLGRLLQASRVGATLEVARLPLSAAVAAVVAETGTWDLPLAAGDDYELCFTVEPARFDTVAAALADAGACTRIGIVAMEPGLRLLGPDGGPVTGDYGGYRHFGDGGG